MVDFLHPKSIGNRASVRVLIRWGAIAISIALVVLASAAMSGNSWLRGRNCVQYVSSLAANSTGFRGAPSMVSSLNDFGDEFLNAQLQNDGDRGAWRQTASVALGSGNCYATDLDKTLGLLSGLGLNLCRFPLEINEYWDGERATPEVADERIVAALQKGVEPLLLFEYYTRHEVALMSYDEWRSIGRAFANRFSPNSDWLLERGIRDRGVRIFTAMNEPMWEEHNPVPIPVSSYVDALAGLADGVHAVDTRLKVGPGGFQEVPLFARQNPYIKPLVPLYNSGKLHAIDIHRYWDVDWIPMQDSRQYALQTQFDTLVDELGIQADVAFWTTEVNFKRRGVSEQQAASGLLTAIWDALGVVNGAGNSRTEFVMPWGLLNSSSDDEFYGMASTLMPWQPTDRGRVVELVARLSAGMHFVELEPRHKGEYVLEGGDRKLWVVQHRAGWSDGFGQPYSLENIPSAATQMQVFGWDGLRDTIELEGCSSMQFASLPREETIMFLAS